MPATLVSRTLLAKRQKAQFDAEATIGRSSSNTVVVPEDFTSVSNNHARIRFDDGLSCYVLEDLESANGTKLDGVPVSKPERLERLHVITLAEQVDYVFRDLAALPARDAAPPPGKAAPAAAGPAKTAPAAAAAAKTAIDPKRTVVETRLDAPVTDATRLEPAAPLGGTRIEPSPLAGGTRIEAPSTDDRPTDDKTRVENLEETKDE